MKAFIAENTPSNKTEVLWKSMNEYGHFGSWYIKSINYF